MMIPSIDLMDGKAVQLVQGRQKVLERADVEELAKRFNVFGDIALIDLDAALGQGNNEKIIRKICSLADCRVGGGIRSEVKANRILGYGAKKIIIGTKAEPDFLGKFNPEMIIASVDSRAGTIVTEGWKKKTNISTLSKIEQLEPFCSEYLYTDVDREGLMKGINLEKIEYLRSKTNNQFTYAGGITTINDILELEKLNIHSQIGMAIYKGQLDLTEVLIEILEFNKGKGLIPTIVEDEIGTTRMLAYSSKESLKQSLEEGKGIYFSRSRQKIWKKGESSGNIQYLKKLRYDCDRDTLKFTVRQIGPTCHTLMDTCFGNKEFNIHDLFNVIQGRLTNKLPDSFTSQIAESDNELKKKILEEAKEVVNFTDKQNLIWEVADLTYFLLVLLAKNRITLKEIQNELWRRRK